MIPGVLPMTPKQSDNPEWVGETSPRSKKLKFQRPRIKTMLIIVFDSQGTVHKEFVPEGKTVNAELYKAVMSWLLKHIQRVLPAAFCSRDFFLLHDNAPAHKAASVSLSLSRFISARLFSGKLKGLHFADVAEIQ
jgi:hypothetical protein